MQIREIFSALSYGEFAHLSIGCEGSGEILENRQPHVVSLMRKALTDMHTRLVLRERECIIHLSEDRSLYTLEPAAACYGITPNDPKALGAGVYVEDSLYEPFIGRMTRITGTELVSFKQDPYSLSDAPLGHTYEGESLEIVSTVFNKIRVRGQKAGDVVKVTYLEDHPTLPIPVVPETKIELPPALYAALEAKIASAVYEGMDGEGQVVKAKILSDRYEGILSQSKDLLVTGYTGLNDNAGFGKKGFR